MKRRRKMGFLTVCLGTVLSIQTPLAAMAVTPEFGRTPEEWERLRDNVLEYEELGDLIYEYNVTVENNRRTFRQLGTDVTYDELAGDYLAEAQGLYQIAGDAESKVERVGLELEARQKENQAINAILNAGDSYSLRWDNLNTEGLLVQEAQNTMNSYYQLQQQLIAAEKNREFLEAQLASYNTRLALQMVTQAEVLSAQQSLQDADSKIIALKSDIETARQKLIVMTGWKQGDTPEIGSMPEVNFDRIAAMDLTKDLETAIENDYNLKIDERKAANAPSQDTRKVYEQTSSMDREQIAVTLNSAYQSVQQAKIAYDEAVLNLNVATRNMATASNQYGLGSISLLEYRQADNGQVAAQTDLEVKKLALLQAMEAYDWIVKGVRTK